MMHIFIPCSPPTHIKTKQFSDHFAKEPPEYGNKHNKPSTPRLFYSSTSKCSKQYCSAPPRSLLLASNASGVEQQGGREKRSKEVGRSTIRTQVRRRTFILLPFFSVECGILDHHYTKCSYRHMYFLQTSFYGRRFVIDCPNFERKFAFYPCGGQNKNDGGARLFVTSEIKGARPEFFV